MQPIRQIILNNNVWLLRTDKWIPKRMCKSQKAKYRDDTRISKETHEPKSIKHHIFLVKSIPSDIEQTTPDILEVF